MDIILFVLIFFNVRLKNRAKRNMLFRTIDLFYYWKRSNCQFRRDLWNHSETLKAGVSHWLSYFQYSNIKHHLIYPHFKVTKMYMKKNLHIHESYEYALDMWNTHTHTPHRYVHRYIQSFYVFVLYYSISLNDVLSQ